MILKTIRTKIFEFEESDIPNQEYFEDEFYSNIKQVSVYVPAEHEDGKMHSILLTFEDGSEYDITVATLKNDVWIYEYKNIFLMNDKGETIERLL